MKTFLAAVQGADVEAFHTVYDRAIQRFADLIGKDHSFQLACFECHVK